MNFMKGNIMKKYLLALVALGVVAFAGCGPSITGYVFVDENDNGLIDEAEMKRANIVANTEYTVFFDGELVERGKTDE